jgi:hypothetical protein
LPCADLEVNSLVHNSIEGLVNTDKHSHDKDNDLCSPFCVCNCCGTQILSYFQVNNFEFPLVSIVIETKEPFYKSILTSNFFGSIWQPPQIV